MDKELEDFMEKKSDEIAKVVRILDEMDYTQKIHVGQLRKLFISFMIATLPHELFEKALQKARKKD